MRRVCSLGSLVWFAPLLLSFGCWSARDTALFDHTDGVSSVAGTGGSAPTPAQAGTDSGAQPNGAGAESGAPVSTGGTSGATGGSQNASGGDLNVGGSAGGGQAGQAPIPVIESCDMLEGAVTSEQNFHCYRVNSDELDFATAVATCHQAGGHLVTISDEAENDFVRDLHDGEHWVGASDGRADNASGVGGYAWVTQEPWEFTAWEDGQPNAHATDCPGEDGGAHCYEHCAFQDGGDWNDRSCWHTIASVCEWDLTGPGGSDMGGAGP